MTRREQLIAMRPRDLIALADKLGVKVAASKNRVNLKEKKSDVVERILLAEDVDTADVLDDTAATVDASVEAVETDFTPMRDIESNSTECVVEFAEPVRGFDLREFLRGATYVSTPISEFVIVETVIKNNEEIGTVAVLGDIVTVTVGVDAESGIEVYIVPVEEYNAVRAEVG